MFRNFVLSLFLSAALAGPYASPSGAVPKGAMCGGIAGLPCDGGLWCDPQPGLCHGADIAGKCVEVPQFCYELYQPVCGCDDKTYSNDCKRQAARAAKKSDGACQPGK